MNINKKILRATPVFVLIIPAYLLVCFIIAGLMGAMILTLGSYTIIAQIIASCAFSGIMVYGLFWLVTDIQKRMTK